MSRQAYFLVPIVGELAGKAESLAQAGSTVFVGTQDGRVLVYALERSRDGCIGRLVGQKQVIKGKRIEQLIAVPEIGTLLVLCDGAITAHSLSDLEILPSGFNVRGARLMAVNQRGPPSFSIVAAMKRKLALFDYHSGQYRFSKELNIGDLPSTMLWIGRTLVVGYRRDYWLINENTGDSVPFGSSRRPSSSIRLFGSLLGPFHHVIPTPPELVLLTILRVFGERQKCPPILSTTSESKFKLYLSPSSIDASKTIPMLELMPESEVLLSTLDKLGVFLSLSGEVAQKNPVNWSQSPSSFGYHVPNIISILPSRAVEVHSAKDQALVQSIPLKGAMCLSCNSLSWQGVPKPLSDPDDLVFIATPLQLFLLQRVPFEQQADDLLKLGKVEEAHEMLIASFPARMPDSERQQRLQRFHETAGITLLTQLRFDDSFFHLSQAQVDPRELIAFFPELQTKYFNYRPLLLEPRVIPYGQSSKPDIASVITEIQMKKNIREPSQRELLSISRSCLCTFLEEAQGQPKAQSSENAMLAVNTALLRLYVSLGRRADVEDLISSGAALDLEESIPFLSTSKLSNAQAMLYRAKGMVPEALSVWAKVGTSKEDIELQNKCIDQTVVVLLNTDSLDLIFKYAAWVLRLDPDRGLKILCGSRKVPLPVEEILHYLDGFQDYTLVQRYLEHLVNDPDTKTVESYHTRLAMEYIRETVDLIQQAGSSRRKSAPVNVKVETGRLQVVRQKLVDFIKRGGSYDMARLLEVTRQNQLIAEYVNLCSKAGRHEDAIDILLYEVGDPRAAEIYCLQFGHAKNLSDARYHDNPLLIRLIKALLNPKDPTQRAQFKERAMSVLRTNAKNINPIQAMEVLPKDLTLSELKDYFSQVLPNSSYRVRDAMIVRNLWRYRFLQVACEKAEAMSRYQEITPDTRCAYDGKRIGDTIFAVYPNGTLVRYKNTNGDLKTDPVTGQRFTEDV